jgi:hypothetical protein
MPTKKHIQPGEKVPLKLTDTERTLVLEELLCLDKEHEQVIRNTPSGKPVMMSLDALDDFGGYIAAEANHCEDKKKRNKLDAVFEKIQRLLDKYTDEEPPKTVKIEDARKAKVISDQAVQVATWAAQVLVVAEQLGIKKQTIEHFQLAPAQRDVLLLVPGISKAIKNKLAKDSSFTVAEVAGMTMALAEDLTEGDARKQLAVLLVAKHLMDQLHDRIVGPAAPSATKKSKPKLKAATKRKAQHPFVGRWRITWMEQWDQDFVDAEVEGFFEFDSKHNGSFQFGYVSGSIDYRLATRDDKPAVEFSWEGNDGMDQAQGRGWAVLHGDELSGTIFVNPGDESEFKAKRKTAK